MLTSYTYEDEDGVSSECSFIFDLELPPTFKPSAGDGEVQKFYLLPIEKVRVWLATPRINHVTIRATLKSPWSKDGVLSF